MVMVMMVMVTVVTVTAVAAMAYGHGNGFGIVPLNHHRAIDLFIAYLGLSLKFTSSSFKNIHTLSDSIALPGKKDPKVMQ